MSEAAQVQQSALLAHQNGSPTATASSPAKRDSSSACRSSSAGTARGLALAEPRDAAMPMQPRAVTHALQPGGGRGARLGLLLEGARKQRRAKEAGRG